MPTVVLDARERATVTYDLEDIEYLRHGDKPLLARVFKPRGAGPFPALIEVHGGAWCLSDRKTEHLRHEFMASHGIVSIALDFRCGYIVCLGRTLVRIQNDSRHGKTSLGVGAL